MLQSLNHFNSLLFYLAEKLIRQKNVLRSDRLIKS